MQLTYRPIKKSEYHFLETMLSETLFVLEGQSKFPKSILEMPEINKSIKDWNRNQFDIAIVAINGKELVGVVWGRQFDAEKCYGFVDVETPEVSIAIKAKFRNQGIGTQLLKLIELSYLEIGVKQLSLSVDKLNPAKEFFKRNGFSFFEDIETDITMLKKIFSREEIIEQLNTHVSKFKKWSDEFGYIEVSYLHWNDVEATFEVIFRTLDFEKLSTKELESIGFLLGRQWDVGIIFPYFNTEISQIGMTEEQLLIVAEFPIVLK